MNRSCSWVEISKDDRIHEVVFGMDRETGYFTYVFIETVNKKFHERGHFDRYSFFKNTIFDNPLIGIESTTIREHDVENLETITFVEHMCTETDPINPLILEFFEIRYPAYFQALEYKKLGEQGKLHDYTNDWRPPPIEYPDEEEEELAEDEEEEVEDDMSYIDQLLAEQ